ncbi:spermine synthase isoform X3 [Eurosta solidaginis]|uniref:spermine synthase isoform X3 n=1 Tax=Eurosta solidaginis TaxID=178769 RepID=UPI003530CFB2
MTAQTILFDFTVDAEKISDCKQRQEIAKVVRGEVENIFPQVELVYQMTMEDGYFCVLTENKETIITLRIFRQGLVTMNIEYYLEEGKQPLMSFDTMRTMELILRQKLHSDRSKYLPPIKRGGYIDIYMNSSDIAESDLIYTETLMCRGTENYEDKEICILGGGDGALLYELLKENPKYVVMLEIDELVMQACNKYLNTICGGVLEKRNGKNYDIIVGDCVQYMKKYISEHRKFDYVFGDLTDIPISGTPVGEIWDFIRTILESSFKILKSDGKFLTHGNGTACTESLELFEDQLRTLRPKVKFTTSKAFVPSFMEEWQFYQVSLA